MKLMLPILSETWFGETGDGEDYGEISTDRFGGGLVAEWSYVCQGSKWPGFITGPKNPNLYGYYR
jgi:hypothetical protein